MTTPIAPRLPIPNGRQLTLRLRQGTQDAAIVLGFVGGGPLDGDASGVNGLRDAAWTTLRPVIYSDVSCTGAVWRDVSQAEGDSVEVGAPSNPGGVAGGVASIAAACTLIRWTTGGGGRSGRGRTYLPGLATVSVATDGRTYTPAYVTTVNGVINAYLNHAQWSSNGLQPAVLSFRKGQARPIEGGSLSPVIGVQRRRMR